MWNVAAVATVLYQCPIQRIRFVVSARHRERSMDLPDSSLRTETSSPLRYHGVNIAPWFCFFATRMCSRLMNVGTGGLIWYRSTGTVSSQCQEVLSKFFCVLVAMQSSRSCGQICQAFGRPVQVPRDSKNFMRIQLIWFRI